MPVSAILLKGTGHHIFLRGVLLSHSSKDIFKLNLVSS